MRNHRLDRLARLTQGAALVGFGLASSACGKDQVEPVHVNSPPVDSQRPTMNATAPPVVNSVPPPIASAPSGSSATGSAAIQASARQRPTMNAPPKAQ